MSKGCIKVSTKFDFLKIIKIIKSIIFKFEDYKYLPLLIHQEKTIFNTLHQVNMSNVNYLEKFNNLVDMASLFKGQLHNQAILDIVIEKK